MPIPFTCPHCGRQTVVADQYAGQSGPCAGCGKTITVPLAGAPPFTPPVKRSNSLPVVLAIVAAALVGMLMCSGILVALLLPAVQAAREAARRSLCVNNLKQIALATHNYHDTYRCFPPAYIPDANGKPMHSWRVLLLPYLERQDLYEMYDFDEPWNGPNNAILANMMPEVFNCPSSHRGDAGSETCYAMIVGPGTISDGPTAHSFGDIADGSSNTIMVVEVAGSGINWMEPRDLDAQKISYQINNPAETEGIKSKHPGGANVAICDGSIRFLNDQVDKEVVKQMTTIAGGEQIPDSSDSFDF